MGESHQRRLVPIALGDTPMLRIHSTFLALLLLLGPASARAFEVFQDPTNTGTNPGAPLVVSDPSTALNLFIHQEGVAADPNGACSGTAAAGAEFCGWDLHIVGHGGLLPWGARGRYRTPCIWCVGPALERGAVGGRGDARRRGPHSLAIPERP